MVAVNPVTGLASAPIFATWYSTRRCNLTCSHCFVEVIDADEQAPEELSTAQGKQLIDILVESEVYQLAFAGGEPLVRPDFFELAAYARGRGLTIQVSTNGLLLPGGAARLIEVGFKCVQVSVDGVTAEANAVLRGKDSFDPALSTIRDCVRAGLPVVLAYTVHQANKGSIADLVAFAERERVSIVKLQPVSRPFTYRGTHRQGTLAPSEARAAIEEAERRFASSSIRLCVTSSAEMYSRRVQDRHCGFENAVIFPSGTVGTCDQDEALVVRNSFTKGFLRAWDTAVRRMLVQPHCGCLLGAEVT